MAHVAGSVFGRVAEPAATRQLNDRGDRSELVPARVASGQRVLEAGPAVASERDRLSQHRPGRALLAVVQARNANAVPVERCVNLAHASSGGLT